jgi:GAF domain-containing protein
MLQGTVQISRDLDKTADQAALEGSDEAKDAVSVDGLPRYARSEIAVPLRSRGNVTGVLVAQSYDGDAFDDVFAEILQVLADHLAVAIDSVRLYAEREEAAARLQRAYGELTREAWLEVLGEQVGRGYESSVIGTKPLPPLPPQSWQKGEQQALTTGKPVMLHAQDTSGTPLSRAVLPIRARGEVIGVLDVSRMVEGDGPAADRGLTADELAELEAIAAQLGLALENARLYELARQGAVEEQLVGRVTQRMRETLSVDTVLQTAVAELRELLDLEGVEVRMGMALEEGGAADDEAASSGNGSDDHQVRGV